MRSGSDGTIADIENKLERLIIILCISVSRVCTEVADYRALDVRSFFFFFSSFQGSSLFASRQFLLPVGQDILPVRSPSPSIYLAPRRVRKLSFAFVSVLPRKRSRCGLAYYLLRSAPLASVFFAILTSIAVQFQLSRDTLPFVLFNPSLLLAATQQRFRITPRPPP